MATYLLTWNPGVWPWPTLKEDIARMSQELPQEFWWNTGVTTRISPSDQFFLMKLGKKEPKGIIGSGIFIDIPRKRWDEDLEREVLSAPIEFNSLIYPDEPTILSLATLTEQVAAKGWTPQASGTSIPDSLVPKIEVLWQQKLQVLKVVAKVLLEGDLRRVVSDRRERKPEARRRCIEHHGLNCVICDFNFGTFYGEIGEGLIHVHHLKPLSEAAGEREVDPIKDLRPVCANCHQVIHRRKVALTLGEMRQAILKRRT